ncbi:hypothetical protein B0H19DRAFT_1078032 [Mycena capillaripes]|nr:hypothetical protein B0H19DRAFT_1277134 [Mycena capillaripes]KAJ6540631.1 hypothetical protein B0H19DRAFT_1078032 [Mycena capillaripes]
MSSNPAHYNTADRVRFENYADDLRNAGAGLGPYPGPPPPGYREFFRLGHKYAPVPEDYPHLLRNKEHQAVVPRTNAADVYMSAAALGTILDSQHKLMSSVIAMNQQALVVYKPKPDHHPVPFNRGYQRGGHRMDGPGHVGGGRKRSRPYRKHKNNGNEDIASDVATAGGLTDNENDGYMVTPEDVPEEDEFYGDVDMGSTSQRV